MTKRNNSDRIGGEVDTSSPTSFSGGQFNFAIPTEFVDLPSGGRYYSEDHPLYKQDTLEIKYMTAKEEDILNSPSLLKKGVAIDRMLDNLIVDKRVKTKDLLIGDKNALVVAARVSGYGSDYSARVTCPSCKKSSEEEIDLETALTMQGAVKDIIEGVEQVSMSSRGYPQLTLPKSGYTIEMRFMTSTDERELEQIQEKAKKHNLGDSIYTNILKRMILSVNDDPDVSTIHQFVELLPAMDSKFIRGTYKILNPTAQLQHDYTCVHCGHDGTVEVPINPTFFWPEQ